MELPPNLSAQQDHIARPRCASSNQTPMPRFVRSASTCSSLMLTSLLILLLIASFSMNGAFGIRWLGIYRLPRTADHPSDTTADRFSTAECHKAANELGLRRRQMRFCNHPLYGYAMLAVLRAAHAVGYHCPRAFADRRWNCTSIHRLPDISPELKRGTREQALVHAFSSAALLFEVGRYCALNKIRFCSCGDERSAYIAPEYAAGMGATDDPMNPNNALIYQSGAGNIPDALNPSLSNANAMPMTNGQPTVSRFYWAGCSDNLRVAREYASTFLGFPNIPGASLPSPEPIHEEMLPDMDARKLRRALRSILTQDPGDGTGEDDDDDNEDSDGDEDDSVGTMHAPRLRRNMDYAWTYPHQQQGRQAMPTENRRYPVRPHRSSSYEPPYRTASRSTMRRNSQSNYVSRRWPRRPKPGKRRKSPIIRVMDRHNYLAGVVLMEANHKLVCKCHGVSGSCAQRVCFRQLRRIDDENMQKALKMRYLAAKQVMLGINQDLIAKTFTGAGFVDEVVQPEELVFNEHSPDYCNVEPHRGSVGTHSRVCTLKDGGTSNCVNMCCGRGYQNVTVADMVQCNCRMVQGFKVRCEECRVEVVTHRCL